MLKEIDYLKVKFIYWNDFELEDVGISVFFVLECYGWFCVGEIIGCGGIIVGYKV